MFVFGPIKRAVIQDSLQENIVARLRVYNAGGENLGPIAIEGGVLRLQGVQVDRVTDFVAQSGESLDLDQVRRKVGAWARNARFKYPATGETFQEAVFKNRHGRREAQH